MAVDTTDSWLVEASGAGYLNAIPINSSTANSAPHAAPVTFRSPASRSIS